VADLTGNGIADLVTANYAGNNVSVLLGNGNGTFQGALHFNAGSQPWSVAVGDFNGDGIPDLATANLSGSVRVLLGNGNGTFQTEPFGYVTGYSQGVAVGDFQGDGRLDLAVTSGYSDSVVILANDGHWDGSAPHGGRAAGRHRAALGSVVASLPVPATHAADARTGAGLPRSPVSPRPTPEIVAAPGARSAPVSAPRPVATLRPAEDVGVKDALG
jgi:hypothetical protein